MSLSSRLAMVALLLLAGCGDHYEGGGRRRELPTEPGADTLPVEAGEGTSTTGGGASVEPEPSLSGAASEDAP